jgi:hypothetical protein
MFVCMFPSEVGRYAEIGERVRVLCMQYARHVDGDMVLLSDMHRNGALV